MRNAYKENKEKRNKVDQIHLYKTSNTRKLIEINSFLPSLTNTEFKSIFQSTEDKSHFMKNSNKNLE